MKNCLFSSAHNTIVSRITEVGCLGKRNLWKNIGTKYCYYRHTLKILRYLNVSGLPNINPAES